MLPEVGQTAPDFTLPNQNGENITLSNLKGKWVVLYFYPKALTPGCTTQAENLRDSIKELKALGAEVIGVSADETKKLAKFAEKHELPFPLVGDTAHSMLEAYGMWQEKSMYGRTYMGVMRSTFIIDPQGKIAHFIAKASPKTHHEDVMKWLKDHGCKNAA